MNTLNSTFIKGLFMAIVALLATTFTTTGLPTTATGWIVLAITAIGTTLIYLAKNWVFPSTSTFGNISIGDLISGVLIAIGSGLSSWAASVITSTPVNWSSLGHLMIVVILGYFGKQFATAGTPATT